MSFVRSAIKFILPPHLATNTLTVATAYIAGLSIYHGAQSLRQEDNPGAALNFAVAFAAAAFSSRSRKVSVLEEENQMLRADLFSYEMQSQLREAVDRMFSGAHFEAEASNDGDVLEGDFIREVPDTGLANTMK